MVDIEASEAQSTIMPSSTLRSPVRIYIEQDVVCVCCGGYACMYVCPYVCGVCVCVIPTSDVRCVMCDVFCVMCGV